MNISRGGYVIINLEGYNFVYRQDEGEYSAVTVDKDIISLIKYAYEKGKPVCVNNVKTINENGDEEVFTALWGVVSFNINSLEYYIPRFVVNYTYNTLTFA